MTHLHSCGIPPSLIPLHQDLVYPLYWPLLFARISLQPPPLQSSFPQLPPPPLSSKKWAEAIDWKCKTMFTQCNIVSTIKRSELNYDIETHLHANGCCFVRCRRYAVVSKVRWDMCRYCLINMFQAIKI